MTERKDEIYTIGPERVSVTIDQKTKDDKLVFRNTSERWFISPDAAEAAQGRLLNVLVASEAELISDGDDLRKRRELRDGGGAA